MKKFMSILISIIVLISSVTVVTADDYISADNLYVIEPLTAVTYDATFGSQNANVIGSYRNINTAEDTANIVYELSIDEADNTKGYITANIELLINNISYVVNAVGYAEATLLSNDTYWQACLKGFLNNDSLTGEEVWIHFSKLNSKNDVLVSVSMSTTHGPLSFMFGDLVLDEETYRELNATRSIGNSNYSVLSTDVYQPIPNSEFSVVGNAFTNYSFPEMQYYSQRARAFYNPNANRVAVSLKTYASYFNDYKYSYGGYFDATYLTGIHEMEISLVRTTSQDYTYIENIENPNLQVSMSYTQMYLYSLFYDALSVLGVPTNTIELVLGNNQGIFNTSIYSDSCTIYMLAPYSEYYDYDSVEQGVPIIFQLDSSTPATGEYIYLTDLTYKTLMTRPTYDPLTGIITGNQETILYYDAGSAVSTISVYVQ